MRLSIIDNQVKTNYVYIRSEGKTKAKARSDLAAMEVRKFSNFLHPLRLVVDCN